MRRQKKHVTKWNIQLKFTDMQRSRSCRVPKPTGWAAANDRERKEGVEGYKSINYSSITNKLRNGLLGRRRDFGIVQRGGE